MQGRFSASNPAAAAVSSIRLLVVSGSNPDSSFSTPRNTRIAAQPPGPGLGLQPPSVQISTTWPGSGGRETTTSSDAIGMLVPRAQVEPQAAQVFQRILAGDQGAR